MGMQNAVHIPVRPLLMYFNMNACKCNKRDEQVSLHLK